jgi:excisionase family DNA binding protein
MTPQSKERSLLTVPVIAERAHVSTKTVWRWISAGELKCHRLGKRLVRVTEDDYSTFINARRR